MKPQSETQVGQFPLSDLDALLILALTAKIHTGRKQLRKVAREISPRIEGSATSFLVSLLPQSKRPELVVWEAVSNYIEDTSKQGL